MHVMGIKFIIMQSGNKHCKWLINTDMIDSQANNFMWTISVNYIN